MQEEGQNYEEPGHEQLISIFESLSQIEQQIK